MKTLDMPSFGADMETGKVVEWCAKAGDTLKKGDTVALIETAKGLIDMEVFEDCIVEDFLVALDDEVDVGSAIIRVKGDASSAQENATGVPKTADVIAPLSDPKLDEPEAIHTEKEAIPVAPGVTNNVIDLKPLITGRRITPAAKKYIAEHNIAKDNRAFEHIKSTGTGDAVCLADVQAFSTNANQGSNAEAKSVARKPSGFDPNAMRKAIAAVVSKSKREIPHYYLSLEVDLHKAEHWLETQNTQCQPEDRLMINVPLMCAVARALYKHPDFNGFYTDDTFHHAVDVHLGLAIRLRNKGLVSPAIHNAQKLNALEMMEKLRDLVERAKLGGLKQSELQDPTTTLSNIGDRGCDQIFGVIFPPQVAIIGVGKVTKRVVAVNDTMEIHSMVNISLAADHRVTDGQMGARFLNEISKLLQRPEQFERGAL